MRTYYYNRILRLGFLFVLICAQFESFGQDVILKTQAEVDAFDPTVTMIDGFLLIGTSSGTTDIVDLSNLSGLTTIIGDLRIEGNDILTNINGLNNITSVGRSLILENNLELTNIDGLSSLMSIDKNLSITTPKLTNIDGLSNLMSLGGELSIVSNAALNNIDGLKNLTYVPFRISINFNESLVSLDGLSGLETTGTDIYIFRNSSLLDIDGLINLKSVGRGINIEENVNLQRIDGLSNLSSIGAFLAISDNENLLNIDALSKVTSVGTHVSIRGNQSLLNIDGLNNLSAVGTNVSITNNENLLNIDGLRNLETVQERILIAGCDKIENLDGLMNLPSVGGDLIIQGNDNLENVDGLSNITFIGGRIDLNNNAKLVDCCGIQNILENQETAIVGNVQINSNPSECSSEQVVLAADCGLKLSVNTFPPCIGYDNGFISVNVDNYDTIPFYYEWMRQEDGLVGNGESSSDYFTIEMLGAGTYNIIVTNDTPDTAITNDIALSQVDGVVFEIIELTTTNSSNGLSNGSIKITTDGGVAPYTYTWSGVESGSESNVMDNFNIIPFLGYGEYTITIEDNDGASKTVNVSLLDEEVQVVECEGPLDIVILNDVSGSVDATEYMESKQFFIDFLKEVNLGSGVADSRAAIVEWSSPANQEIMIPITGDLNILESYIDDTRAFSGGTYPHEAMSYGVSYLETNGRTDTEKVLILSTDGSGSQISSSLIALADEFKANGYHIISVAFDNAFSSSNAREILRQVASVDALAPGASSYSQLDAELANTIVNNYLCPIDPGSSATAYFNRDGAIDIIEIEPVGNCPFPDFVEVTFEVSAHRELSIPAGTYVTFYHNNPNQAGATSILTWQIPCAIPVDSTESYTITIPMDGPSNVFAVLNDDGVQGPPINFPITSTKEIAYSNNIDNERVCLNGEATIQALKYATLPIPACDTLVTYTINVCNISDIDAFGVIVEDVPPAGFVLVGTVLNDNNCATELVGSYNLPADCCFSLSLTYDAAAAEYGYYGDQDVILDGPANQTYIDFDGSATTDEDVKIDGSIDCPSSNIFFTKSVNVEESCDDGFVEFTFTITNEMNIPLKGLTFEDVLPSPCTWAYLPYGESGLSIANPNAMGEVATFIIDEVQANTVATFSMDASLNFWSGDGTLTNTARIGNVPDVINGGFKSLTSNATNTQITASPIITIPEIIEVNSGVDSVNLEAILSTFADVSWTTEGDGQFSDVNNESTSYVFGAQDLLDSQVALFISAKSECNETGASVLIQFSACLDNEFLEIQLDADNLTCENNQVEIVVSSNVVLDSIIWSGPSNEGLNGNNLLASIAGEYELIGYSGDCKDTVSIILEETPTEVTESYSICEGQSIEINGVVYFFSGTYQQTINSDIGCDTTLNIELEVIEDVIEEQTYVIQAGDILDVNGVEYDSEGQYIQNFISSNGCDSILIINILNDEALISFDFDDCTAFVQTMSNADYSEFTPFYHSELDCGSITSSNIYRDDPLENMHSCTEGLNESVSMCISSELSCEFDKNSTKMVKIDLEINPSPNGEIVLTAIEFFQQAPEMFSWLNGEDGLNNYPTQYGVRILKDGVEIYYNENNPTALTWNKEEFVFTNDDNFVFTESTNLEIQLLSYCTVGVESPVTAWDLEDLKIYGSCSAGAGSTKVIAGTVLPYANEVLDDVQILIANGPETKQLLTDEEGDYINMANLQNSHINITAHKDDDHLKGVSTLDLLVIQRHLLGLANFENPLHFIAADVNYDGKVSVADLRDLRKLILGIYSEFPYNDSYRFLNKKDVPEASAANWKISEHIEIQNLSDHILDADFVPVKIGDVIDLGLGQSSDVNASASEKTESLFIVKQESNTDSHTSLEFNLGELMSIHGLHFTIDLNGLNFESVESNLNNFTGDNYNLTDDRILHISWIDAKNDENTSSNLFAINFNENIQSDLLNEVIVSEVYTRDKVYNLEPKVGLAQDDEESILNLAVYPNPINTETIISFDHKEASRVNVSILNLEGRLLHMDTFGTLKGSNKIRIPQDVLHQNAGVYILRLTDQNTSIMRKLMIQN